MLNKISVVTLIAGLCIGIGIGLNAAEVRLEDAAAAVNAARKEARDAKDLAYQLEYKVKIALEEKEDAWNHVPPNADACWKQWRKQQCKLAANR